MHVNKTHLELWEKALPTQVEFFAMPWNEKLKTLIWLGTLAPSSHNTQPWRFYADQDKSSITIAIDTARILPESDILGREAVISIGCTIENIYIASRAYGLRPEIHLHPTDKALLRPKKDMLTQGQIISLVTMQFIHDTPSQEHLALLPSILSRKAMRTEFDPTILVPEEVLEELGKMINDKNTHLHLVTNTMHKLSISEFQGQADSYVLNSPRFAQELGNWLLPNDTDSPIGMPGNTFGFDDAQALRIHLGMLGEGALEPEDMLRFSLGGKLGFEKSPVIAFLTIEQDDISGWIAAGRAIERAFLILEREGISYAVHAAIVEVRLVNRIFAATLGTLKPLAAVFRIGYVKDQSIKKDRPHSPRMPLASVILQELPN